MPRRKDIKVMIIGSVYRIGQCEFDYSGTQACKALQLGYRVVMSAQSGHDHDGSGDGGCDYIEPLDLENVAKSSKERPDTLLPNLGGQSE